MKSLAKIEKFYIVFFLFLIGLVVFFIFTFKRVFDVFLVAYEISHDNQSLDLKIDKDKLEQSYKFVFEKESTPLNIR